MLCGWTRMDDEVRTIKCTVVTAVHGESGTARVACGWNEIADDVRSTFD